MCYTNKYFLDKKVDEFMTNRKMHTLFYTITGT